MRFIRLPIGLGTHADHIAQNGCHIMITYLHAHPKPPYSSVNMPNPPLPLSPHWLTFAMSTLPLTSNRLRPPEPLGTLARLSDASLNTSGDSLSYSVMPLTSVLTRPCGLSLLHGMNRYEKLELELFLLYIASLFSSSQCEHPTSKPFSLFFL